MINTISKSKLGMKIIWCILLCSSPTLRKAKARIQGSNLEAGAKTKAMGEHSLLACFFWVCQVSFFFSPGPSTSRWHWEQWPALSHISQQSRKCSMNILTDLLVESISQLRVPLSRFVSSQQNLWPSVHHRWMCRN